MKIAVDMVAQRTLTEREALLRIDACKANFFLQKQLRADQLENAKPLGECACVECDFLIANYLAVQYAMDHTLHLNVHHSCILTFLVSLLLLVCYYCRYGTVGLARGGNGAGGVQQRRVHGAIDARRGNYILLVIY